MRTSPVLLPLAGEVRRHGPHLALDLESKDGMSQRAGFTRPFLVGIFDGNMYSCFRDTKKPSCVDDCWHEGGCIDLAMKAILVPEYASRIIYAHNGGRFDFLHLMPWVQSHPEYRWKIIPAANGILQLKITRATSRGNHSWVFVDSLKLIPISLKKAAATFGVTLKGEIDLDTNEASPLWEEYNRLDCIALYETMARFFSYVEKHLGGQVGLTLPATALQLYRRKYQKVSIARGTSEHAFVRKAYYGGRVEVFEESGSGLYSRDINSSYAAAMLEPVPYGEPRTWHGRPHSMFIEGSYVGFVEADVEVPLSLHIPPLPVRWNHKLVFPVGRFAGVWEWSELEHAMQLGVEVTDWKHSVWYRSAPILAEYASSLYAERHRIPKDPGRMFVCKRCMCSLYGKFGQHPIRRHYCSSEGTGEACDLSGDVKHGEELKDASYIIPQISARITARARVYLDTCMRDVIKLGGKVYYCDTDGLKADVSLPAGDQLGQLKIEYPEYDGRLMGRFLAPKMYWLWADGWGGEAKAKGLQSECKTIESLKKLMRGERLEQRRLQKLGMLARDGFAHLPRMLEVPRHWRGYDASKRIHTGDGHTRPLVFR